MFWNRTPRVQGYIGHYGLSKWWFKTFTDRERAYITERVKLDTLTQGVPEALHKTDGNELAVATFLITLANFFTRLRDAHLGLRMLREAERHDMPPIDEHHLWNTFIQLRHKQRHQDPRALDDVIRACERMIRIAPDVIKTFKWTHWDGDPWSKWTAAPPAHRGYEQLIAIRRQQNDVTEAERLQAEYKHVWRA